MQAIAADENFARAHGRLAFVLGYQWFWDWDEGPARLARAASVGEKGLALDPHDSRCHLALAMSHLFRNAHDSAEHHMTRARDLNPNDDLIMVEQGRLQMYLGRPDAGADLVRTAMRRNPYHPNWYWNALGRCLHSAGDHEAAIPVFDSVINAQLWTHAYLAACYAAKGAERKSAESDRFSLFWTAWSSHLPGLGRSAMVQDRVSIRFTRSIKPLHDIAQGPGCP